MRDRRADARGRRHLLAVLVIGAACGSAPLRNQCLYDGRHYAPGDTFPSVEGCAMCSCSAGGVICGHRACPPDAGTADAGATDARVTDARVTDDSSGGPIDAGSGRCSLDHTYRFGNNGGLVAYVDSSTLTPPRTLVVSRDRFRNAAPAQCMRDVPCYDASLVDVQGIQQALAHPDVVAALATPTPPFYGTDTRPSDGAVFIFERDDQRGFTAGSGNVPPGIRALASLLLRLQSETAATPACAGL
jgi:hypothetical protein